jgi:acetyl-CoA synthetase
VIGVGAAAGKGVKALGGSARARLAALHAGAHRADDAAMILYTRGTTGKPGALLAQRTLLGNLSGYVCAHDFFPQPGDLFWSPLDWASDRRSLRRAAADLALRLPLLAYNGRFDAGKAFALIEKYGVRNCLLFPAALRQMMATVPDPRAIRDLDLRILVSAGAPLTEAVRDWAREKLGVIIDETGSQTSGDLARTNADGDLWYEDRDDQAIRRAASVDVGNRDPA